VLGQISIKGTLGQWAPGYALFLYHRDTFRQENVQISYDASWRGVWSNRQSAVIWEREVGRIVLSYNFYSGWKSLIYISSCFIYGMWWGKELAENVRIPSYGGEGSKIAKNKRHIKLKHSPGPLRRGTERTSYPGPGLGGPGNRYQRFQPQNVVKQLSYTYY